MPAPTAGATGFGARLGRAELLVRSWAPVVLGIAVTVVYLLLQKRLSVNSFDQVGALAADNMSRELAWQAKLIVARTHWAASIFVAVIIMLAIAGLSLQAIVKARPPILVWLFVILSISTIWVIFRVRPDAAVPTFMHHEMVLVGEVSGFQPEKHLVTFLSALFSTATLLAVALSLLLQPLLRRCFQLAELVAAQREIRILLGISAVWLIVGAIGIGLFHRMATACAPPSGQPTLEALGAASTIFSGAFYSALLAAAFAPVELAIREAALTAVPADVVPGEADGWLKKQGLEPSLPGVLVRLIAVMGPLLAGVVQNLAKVAP